MKPEIVDAIGLSLNFPSEPDIEIQRDNIIQTIDAMFERDVRIVTIEGDRGCGKTVLLSQFARSHSKNTVSLFINPVNRLATDPLTFRLDMANQVKWILDGDPLDIERLHENQYVQLLERLRRRAKTYGERYYFVVDGLTPLAEQDAKARDTLFQELLHVSVPQFRFLLSGSTEDIPRPLRDGIPNKPLQLATFSLPESRDYLKHCGVEGDVAEELHRMCSNGFPGFLASVARQIQDGVSPEDLLSHNPSRMPDFMALEWTRVERSSHADDLILGVLAFSRGELKLQEIARIVEAEPGHVERFLNRVRIVDLDRGKPQYLTDSHRSYAQEQLRALREEVLDRIISFLVSHEEQGDVLTTLPDYYREAGRFGDILALLTPGRLAKLAVETGSLVPAFRQTEIGLEAARGLRHFEPTVGMSVQRSAVRELGQADVFRSEVEARVALQDLEAAMALAQSAALVEDKLQLLAAVAKARHEQGLEVGADVLDQIRALAKVASPESLGDRAARIASDLVSVDTDLAISIAESVKDPDGNEGNNEFAIAMLSTSVNADPDGGASTRVAAERLQERVRDPDLRAFMSALAAITRTAGAADVLQRAKRLKPKNQLLILRAWAVQNREKRDAGQVISAGLDLLVQFSSEQVPLTRDLRELSTPLAYLEGEDEKRSLVGRFDTLKGTVRELSATIDLVRLELHLAAAERGYSPESAEDRLQELFWMLVDLSDESLRAQCLARLIAHLKPLDRSADAEALYKLALDNLNKDIDRLAASTAYHYTQLSGVIRALARESPRQALSICARLNTQERRDRAYMQLVRSILKVPLAIQDLDVAREAILSVANEEDRALLLAETLKDVADNAREAGDEYKGNVLALVNMAHDLPDAFYRCNCYAHGLVYLASQESQSGNLRENLRSRLRESWDAIDTTWHKIDVGFRIARTIADVENSSALEYLSDAESLRRSVHIDSAGPATAVIASLRLLLRAFAGLLPQHLEGEEDLRAIEKLVSAVPSAVEQTGLWTDLALRCHQAGRLDLCNQLVTKHIRTALDRIPAGDSSSKGLATSVASPALFVYHADTALEQIRALRRQDREEAIARSCHYLLTNTLPDDPYRPSKKTSTPLTYETATDICHLLDLAEDEGTLVAAIIPTAQAVNESFDGTEQQASTIRERLSQIAEAKLPDGSNIRHDGYRILLRAQIFSKSNNGDFWQSVVDQANSIPNVSDQVYVLSYVCSIIPERLHKMRAQLAAHAEDSIKDIPSLIERTQRYIDLASLTQGFDATAARRQLEKAMQDTFSLEDSSETYTLQRKAIDVAHALDPEFAERLGALLDSDPGRERARASIESQLGTLNAWQQMLNRPKELERAKDQDLERYSKAAWMTLGSLNANRVQTVHVEDVQGFLELSSKGPIGLTYPIHAWIIENSVRRHSRTAGMQQQLVDLFRALLRAAQLASNMSGIHLGQYSELPQARPRAEGSSTDWDTFSDGERDRALAWITGWLASSSEYLIVCDPYFEPRDVELLGLVKSASPSLDVTIITSRQHLQKLGVLDRIDEVVMRAWRDISDQSPPTTRLIVAAQRDDNAFPIHDRYFVSQGQGLFLGTSFHSLGIGKVSKVRRLAPDESIDLEERVLRPVAHMRLDFEGKRMWYRSVDL